MELTKEQTDMIDKAVADKLAAIKADEEAKKVKEKFNPGMGSTVQIIKDESDQPFANLGEQLKAISKAGYPGAAIREPRLKRCIEGALHSVTKAPTGLGETVPSDGAFLVAQEFIPTLIDRVWNTSVVYSKCSKQPVGANFNGFKIPAIDETSRANGSRWGGVQAYWMSEAASITSSKPKFRQISVELQKLVALCYATEELLQDDVALEGYVNRWFPMEFGFKLDDAVINGDGAGKPLGMLQSPGRVTVTKETGQLADTIVTNNILKMWRRMYAPSMGNAVWFVNQDTLAQLATLTIPIGTAGALANLFQLPGSITQGSPYGTMLNRPVIPIEQCPTIGDEGDVMFADPTQYIVGEKGGINAATSIHVAFATDQVAFRFTYRCNGQPVWYSALTPFKGSDTISPYVTIAERA